jgi:hypothetical protein
MRSLPLSEPARVGRKLRCPQCGCPFTVTAHDLGIAPSPAAHNLAAPPVETRAAPSPIPGQSPSPQPSRGLLLAGILTGLVVFLGGAVALALYFANREPPDSRTASNDPSKDDKDTKDQGGQKARDSNPAATAGGERSPRPSTTELPKEQIVRPSDYEKPRPKPDADPVRDPMAPAPPDPTKFHTSLSAEDQTRANKAIERGVDYLKTNQKLDGTWNGPGHPLGMAALPALTLLECGVPADDKSVQKAAAFVRAHAPGNNATYDIALSILFLDRLGDKKDEPLIKKLGLRLIAGQAASGGWSYKCDLIDPRAEPGFLFVLEQTRPRNPLELFVTGTDGKANLELIGIDQKVKLSPELIDMSTRLDPDGPFRGVLDGVSKLRPDVKAPDSTVPRNDANLTGKERKEKTEATRIAFAKLPPELRRVPALQPPSSMKELPRGDNNKTDNSNTQFAILGVLAAAQHGVPAERAMGLIVQRFRTSQNTDGSFGYHFARGTNMPGEPPMTGAGLIGLAVTHGLTAGVKMEGMAAKGVQDKDIQKALKALSRNIERPLDKAGRPPRRQPINLYFLWTVERVGMLYGLPKINDKDWYHWGAEELLQAQMKDGAWMAGGYPGTSLQTDTCFALLFLKRANLAKDLTVKIQSKLELIIEDKP